VWFALLSVVWNPHPEILPGILPVRWYGLLFMSGFVLGYILLKQVWIKEGKEVQVLDDLAVYMGLGTVIGARLGHCLFYEPVYYLSHPLDILKVWEGGLASHGAAITIPVALWLFVRKHPTFGFWWIMDRVVVVVALAGGLIRLGNLMNSEIVGQPTDLPWAFVFARLGEDFGRHPTQIYEAAFYFLSFGILYSLYTKGRAGQKPGFLLGMFLVLVFGFRFLIEFLKANQVAFEYHMTINMGQWLSIPLVVGGILLLMGLIPGQKGAKDHRQA
jgi:prolipoprotein diacylglyceryl transferase